MLIEEGSENSAIFVVGNLTIGDDMGGSCGI